jgi:putative phosphoesterase
MKLLFASDLHGDAVATRRLLEIFEGEGAQRLVLLGDILYHGPRNPLPAGYDPRGVIALLETMGDKILCVRGNCDAEVDLMVLPFSLSAVWEKLPLRGGKEMHLTHGHHLGEAGGPVMQAGDVVVHGHTHVAGVCTLADGTVCLNPGSVSLPKGGTPACYMVYDGVRFSIRRLSDGSEFASYQP